MQWLQKLLDYKIIRQIDAEFGRFILLRHGATDEALFLLVVLVSVELGRKNVCLDLNQVNVIAPLGSIPDDVELPDMRFVLQHLGDYSCISYGDIIQAEPSTPLVLYQHRLYLQRYWYYEVSVSKWLANKTANDSPVNELVAKQWLNQLFAPTNDIDWQKVACTMALRKPFAVITGGPGTGKTTTVTKLLVLVVAQMMAQQQQNRPIIKLVTPTGKAAARLSESIKEAKAKLLLDNSINDLIPDEASTVHRLLGVKPKSAGFIHNRDNRLHLDLLVVDEVSMVDLPMMSKLLEALPDNAKVVLLGDKDQLSSVEAGSVLADICGSGAATMRFSHEMRETIQSLAQIDINEQLIPQKTLADCVVMLQKSHRFDDRSGIGQLAKAVNRGDSVGVDYLKKSLNEAIEFRDITDGEMLHLISHSAYAYQPYLQMVQDGAEPKAIIEAFSRYQVLCAVREGEYGVSGINQAIEDFLAKMKLIDPRQLYYAGRPIMISQNDYSLQLYNGDIGLILPDSTTGHLKAWFIDSDGQVRSVYPNRLPSHEAVYAMTVHKSQGSEFDEVSFVLPSAEQAFGNSVISRELIYTGITRARKRFNLYAQTTVLNSAIAEPVKRASGLMQMLYCE